MIKKLFISIIFSLFCLGVFASPVEKTVISSTTLNATTHGVSSDSKKSSLYKRMTYFITHDVTEQAIGNVTAQLKVDVSFDGETTWQETSFFDVAGGTTPQTREDLTGDGNYVFWLHPDQSAPAVRVRISGYGTDANNTMVITGRFTGIK